jgi:hypothetical protein|tara:strand:- start:353 stop:574 length:222 start_codon:yes stop_codon:yes gene_type:complete
MVLGDLMGFSDSDYAYNQQRAHSADLFFIKMRAWFWGSCATLSALLIGNIMGVFDLNIMGSLISLVKSMLGGH